MLCMHSAVWRLHAPHTGCVPHYNMTFTQLSSKTYRISSYRLIKNVPLLFMGPLSAFGNSLTFLLAPPSCHNYLQYKEASHHASLWKNSFYFGCRMNLRLMPHWGQTTLLSCIIKLAVGIKHQDKIYICSPTADTMIHEPSMSLTAVRCSQCYSL